MRRLIIIVALVVLSVAAATIADHPGSVDITWWDWEVDTSVGVLAAALAVTAFALWALFALIASLVRLPARFRRNRRDRRRRAGETALARGLTALAAGDPAAAQRHAGRAEMLLAGSPLTLLLAAQAAQLAGDEVTARGRYTALLERRDGEFLGLRGLIGQALKAGNGEDALRLARRAQSLRPNAAWVFETLFALEVAAGRWEAARDALDDAVRHRLMPEARAAHHRAVILYELSLAADAAGRTRRAMSLAAGSAALAPDFAPASVRHARLLIGEDRRRAAQRAVERAWHRAPHPELARVWGELGSAMPALKVVTWFERLAAQKPDAVDSHVAIAEAALAAQLWGEARRHLGLAIAAAEPEIPARRLCLLMARLEDSEHPQSGAAREWLDRALAAPADLAYVCATCGNETGDWRPLCTHCRDFDTLRWQPPSSFVLVAPALPMAEAVSIAPLPAIPHRLSSAERPEG